MSNDPSRLEQLITDHDDAFRRMRRWEAELASEEVKPHPDPQRVEDLFRMIASLQTQIGEIQNDPAFEEPPA